MSPHMEEYRQGRLYGEICGIPRSVSGRLPYNNPPHTIARKNCPFSYNLLTLQDALSHCLLLVFSILTRELAACNGTDVKASLSLFLQVQLMLTPGSAWKAQNRRPTNQKRSREKRVERQKQNKTNKNKINPCSGRVNKSSSGNCHFKAQFLRIDYIAVQSHTDPFVYSFFNSIREILFGNQLVRGS